MASQSWVVTDALTVEVDPARLVRVQLVGGGVRVVPRPEPGIAVVIQDVVGNPLEVTASADELNIGYPTIGWDGWLKRLGSYRSADSARIRLEIGSEAQVRIATVNGEVHLDGLVADTKVTTASGPVHGTGAVGSLTVRTVSGATTLENHRGVVAVNTVSGRSDISGDIPRLDLATASGHAVAVTERASSVVRAQTVSAQVDLTIPADSGLSLKVHTVTGGVEVDGVNRRSGGGPALVRVDERAAQTAFVEAMTVTGRIAVRRAT